MSVQDQVPVITVSDSEQVGDNVSELQTADSVQDSAQLHPGRDSRLESLLCVPRMTSAETVDKANSSSDSDVSAHRCDSAEIKEQNKQESSSDLHVQASSAGPQSIVNTNDILPHRSVPQIVVSNKIQVIYHVLNFLFIVDGLKA